MADDDMELVMPFIVCQSNGGPYDDASYVAGWELGALDVKLSMFTSVGELPGPHVIRRDNFKQAELVAMKHKLLLTEVGWDPANTDDETDALDGEWATVSFEWSLP